VRGSQAVLAAEITELSITYHWIIIIIQ
jgi:hypothetical protein